MTCNCWQTADAQTRRTSVRQHSSTAQNRKALNRSQSQQNTANVSKKTALTAGYEIKALKRVCVSNKYIVYLENNKNNAIVGIERSTGNVKTIVPGIANIYEDARPYFYEVWVSGNRIFAEVSLSRYSHEAGKVEYWEYDLETGKLNTIHKDWYNFLEANKDYILVINQKTRLAELWDSNQMKCVGKYENDDFRFEGYGLKLFISSDGKIWRWHYGLAQLLPRGGEKTYGLDTEYMQRNNVDKIGKIRQRGDLLYVAAKRRIYVTNLLQPGEWKEFAKVPATEDNVFHTYIVDSKGNLWTQGDESKGDTERYIELYKAGDFDNPIPMGTSFKTGLSQYFWTDISLSGIEMDDDDNMIRIEDSRRLYIYNRNGVVGYTNGVGKITTINKY